MLSSVPHKVIRCSLGADFTRCFNSVLSSFFPFFSYNMNSFNAVLVQIKFRHTVALWYLRSSLHRPLLPLPSPNTQTERTVNYGSTRCRRVGTASPDNGLLETERTDHLEDITLIHTSQTSASGSETTTTISLTTGPNILQTLQ